MAENELISIVVPVYNAEKYLKRCLDSLINQTYKNVEIICVNDGSKDCSLSILEYYSKLDSRLVVLNQVNGGVSQARNNAISVAQGQFIMFVDADDWVNIETCEKALSTIVTENADILMWSYITETENRKSAKEIFPNTIVFEGESLETLHQRYIGVSGQELAHPEMADALCPVWGKLYRKEILDGVKFINLEEIGTYEDGFFNLECFGRAQKAVFIPECLYHYWRGTGDSVTSGYRQNLFLQWIRLFEKMESYIRSNQLPQSYYKALDNRVALSILGLSLNILCAEFGVKKKIKEIARIIASERYRKAYKQLDFHFFPIHWKLFYGCAKSRNALGIYILANVIRQIIR